MFIIYLLNASDRVQKYGPSSLFTVQRESASALKCDAIDIIQTDHTGNVRKENNRRLGRSETTCSIWLGEQTTHKIPLAKKIKNTDESSDTQVVALNVKHIIYSSDAGTMMPSTI